MPIPQSVEYYYNLDLTPESFEASPAKIYFGNYSQYLAQKNDYQSKFGYNTSTNTMQFSRMGRTQRIPMGGTYQGSATGIGSRAGGIPKLGYKMRTDIYGNVIPEITGQGVKRTLGGEQMYKGIPSAMQEFQTQEATRAARAAMAQTAQRAAEYEQATYSPEQLAQGGKVGKELAKQEQAQLRIEQGQQRIKLSENKWNARYADLEKKFGYAKAMQTLREETLTKLAKFQGELRVNLQEDQQAFNAELDKVQRSEKIEDQKTALENAITLLNKRAAIEDSLFDKQRLIKAADDLTEKLIDFDIWQRKEKEQGERKVALEVARRNIMPKDAFIWKFTEAQGRPPTETEIEKAKGKYW